MSSLKDKESTWKDQAYDLFALSLSLADVCTDVLVALTFYSNKHWLYFWISVAIFIIAQFTYSFTFCVNYSGDSETKFALHFCLLLCISPFQSVLFLLTEKSKKVRHFLKKLGFEEVRSDARTHNRTDGDVAEFFKGKVQAHLGFILESLFEAFPQSILQLVAMVQLSQANALTATSILLSMLSVCSKTLIFSHSTHIPSFVFFWLCFVIDGFGMFAAVSWVFADTSSTIAYLWFAKVAICSLPPATAMMTAFMAEVNPFEKVVDTFEDGNHWYHYSGWRILKYPLFILYVLGMAVVIFLFCLGIFLSFCLTAELANMACFPMFLEEESKSHSDIEFYNFVYGFCAGNGHTDKQTGAVSGSLASELAEWRQLMRSKRKRIEQIRLQSADGFKYDSDEKEEAKLNVVEKTKLKQVRGDVLASEKAIHGYYHSPLKIGSKLNLVESFVTRAVWRLPKDVGFRVALCNGAILDSVLLNGGKIETWRVPATELRRQVLATSYFAVRISQAHFMTRLKYHSLSNDELQALTLDKMDSGQQLLLPPASISMRDLRDNLLYFSSFEILDMFYRYIFPFESDVNRDEWKKFAMKAVSLFTLSTVVPLKVFGATLATVFPMLCIVLKLATANNVSSLFASRWIIQTCLSLIHSALFCVLCYFGVRSLKHRYLVAHLYGLNIGYPFVKATPETVPTAELKRAVAKKYVGDRAKMARDLMIHDFFEPLDDLMFALLDDDYIANVESSKWTDIHTTQPLAKTIHTF